MGDPAERAMRTLQQGTNRMKVLQNTARSVEMNQLGRIKDHAQKERTNAEEDARGSGDNQTEGVGEEGVENLQPDGTVTIDNILVPE